MIHNMIHNIKLIAVLALITFGAGQAWARGGGNIKTGTVTGGTLTFYKTYESGTLSDEIGKNGIEAEADKPVYIKATPDGIHTDANMELTAQESTGTGNAQARTLTRSGATDPGVGQTIAVSAVSGKPGIYSFTMPANGNNALVSATFAAKPMNTATISYIDADGITKNKDIGTVYILDGTEITLGRDGTDADNDNKPYETWYICSSTLAYNHTLKTLGNVNIIISGSLTIGTANSPVSSQGFNAKNNLCLYGHASATGTNSVKINSSSSAIFSLSGAVTITNCSLDLTSTNYYGVNADKGITITGCDAGTNSVKINSPSSAIYSMDAVTITNCATVEVTSSGSEGIYAQKDLTITGGQVTVTGANSKDGLISDENIILGWTKASDYIKASSYSIPSGKSVKTADGQRFVAYNMASEGDISATAIVSGSSTDATPTFTLAGINGKTLKPLDGYIVTADGSITLMSAKAADFTITTGEGTEAVTTPYYIYKASTEEAPVSVTLSYGGTDFVKLEGLPEGTTLDAVENQPLQRSFAMPAADVALTATAVTDLTASSTITYSGSAQTPAILLDESAFETTNYIVTDITPKEGSTLTEGKAVNAGSYTITVTGLGQYIGTASVDFTIGKADYDGTTTVSTYVRSGQATTGKTLTLPALPDGASYAATGTVEEETAALIDGTPTVSGTTLTFSTTYQENGASATITIPVTGATNFNDYSVVVTVTAKDKDEAGVTINGGEDKIVTYGATDFTLTKTVTDVGNGTGVWTWTSTNTDVATIGESSGTITIKKAGSTTIRAVYESDTTMGESEITLIVNPKALSVTADNFTVSYGDPAPAYTVSYSGFVNDETSSVLSGTLSFTCSYTSSSNTGDYTITPSGLTSSNYNITFKNGTLTVAAKAVESENGTTVTLDGNGYSVTIDEGSGSSAVIDGSVLDANGEVTIYNLDYSRKLTHPTESNKDVTIGTTPAKLYTTCLPTTPTTNTNVKYYKLASVSNNTLNFTEEISPAANTPYLMAVTGSNDIPEQVTGSSVTLKKTMTGSSANGYTMMGTHTGLSNANAISAAGGTENDTYILQPQSKWGKVTNKAGVYIPPFRAYIVGPATSAGARELNSSFDGETVGIDTLRLTDADGTEHWYDLNGRRIDKPTRKGIYIRNGKMTTTNFTN